MPGQFPGQIVPHLLGRPRTKLPMRSYALCDGEPSEDEPLRNCFDKDDANIEYVMSDMRAVDEDGNEIDV
jgi:hypothetical protein